VDLDRLLTNVDELKISFWGIQEAEYCDAMKLDFTTSLRNVESAIMLSKCRDVSLCIQWLRTPHLTSDADAIRKFWSVRGIDDVRGGDVMWNRAGALVGIKTELDRSEALVPDFSRRVWCSDIYFSDCYSWPGDLVLCCCDFLNGKRVPLGHVECLSLEKIAMLKKSILEGTPPGQCVGCRLPRRVRALQLAPDVLGLLSADEQSMLTYR